MRRAETLSGIVSISVRVVKPVRERHLTTPDTYARVPPSQRAYRINYVAICQCKHRLEASIPFEVVYVEHGYGSGFWIPLWVLSLSLSLFQVWIYCGW